MLAQDLRSKAAWREVGMHGSALLQGIDTTDEQRLAVGSELVNQTGSAGDGVGSVDSVDGGADSVAGVLFASVAVHLDLQVARDTDRAAGSAAFALATLLERWAEAQHLQAAFDLYRTLARFGHGASLLRLGLMSLEGRGMAPDAARALKLLQQAALRGTGEAYHVLGQIFQAGKEGVPADGPLALHYFQLGADGGDPNAIVSLAHLLQQPGAVLPQSKTARSPPEEQAVEWLRRAARLGSRAAMHNLGGCCLQGRGTPVSPSEAVAWYKQAAAAGFWPSAANLGEIYERGMPGIPPDPAEAQRWVALATRLGMPPRS
jgi:TPR repeat protein